MMSASFSCSGTVSNGALVLNSDGRAQMAQWIWHQGDGIKLLVTLEEAHEARGSRANRYYWGAVITPAAKELGYTPEDLHSAMCQMFLPDEQKRVEFFNKVTGERVVIPVDGRRTRKLNRSQFFDYVEQVRQFFAESLSIQTEDPDREFWRKRKEAA